MHGRPLTWIEPMARICWHCCMPGVGLDLWKEVSSSDSVHSDRLLLEFSRGRISFER